jgi:hypothetical protein
MIGLFSKFQPLYAAHRITAFPVSTDTKRPLVSNYLKMGIPATSALAKAKRFTDANALGIAAGKPNRITVLDIDTTNERVLADALARHGEPRVIVRTASGKFHAYYRHNGEPRKIRPWKPLPIDLLGGGFVVAAPSLYGKGQYEIIKGTLDDLAALTTIKNVDDIIRPRHEPPGTAPTISPVGEGKRNFSLFNHLMRYASSIRPNCTLAALKAEARDANAKHCIPQLEETEIMTVASSVWHYEASGNNRFGTHGAWFPVEEIASMLHDDQDAFVLLA